MTENNPNLYFRIRENGAAVFRVDTENRQRRLELILIAIVNSNNGRIKPHGEGELSPAELTEIKAWLLQRTAVLQERALDDIQRTVDHLNLTAQWAQSKASDEELEKVTDPLLMAMHDLRNVLVRKRADSLMRSEGLDD